MTNIKFEYKKHIVLRGKPVELDCCELTPNCVPLKRERLPLEQIELFPEV